MAFKNIEDKKEYQKEYYLKNKAKILKQAKKHYLKNKQEIIERKIKYYKANKDKISEKKKEYYIQNKNKIMEIRKEYYHKKLKTDLKYNLIGRISRAVRHSLNGNKNGWHWETLVGYTLNDLKKRLEKTMPKGYTWQDFLDGKLHIDHIIPKSVFNFTKPEHVDFKRCWALENLQLLPVEENWSKNNRLYKPFQPALYI